MSLIQTMVRENKDRSFNTVERFIKLKQGDESQRDEIIKQWLGLALKIANSYERIENCDADDYFSVATEGLIKAVDNFDVTKNVEFSTFATTCIKNEIFVFVKKNKRNLFSSLDVPVYDNESESDSNKLIDFISYDDDDSGFSRVETKVDYEMILSEMKKILNEREMTIIKLHFGLVDGVSWTFREIDKKLGVSGTCKLLNQAITKVQKQFFPNASNEEKEPVVFQSHKFRKLNLVHSMKDVLDKILDEKELAVIKLRYGVLDGKMKTHQEVNEILGLSKVRVGEIDRKAILKLQVVNGRKSKDVSYNI